MPDLINHLAQLIAQDNAVLFIGTGLRQANETQSVMQQLTETLAQQIEYKRPDRSLPAVARDFEVLRGRTALILALREELETLNHSKDPLYQLLADAVLPMTKVITTRIDHAIEQTLNHFQKPYILIVRDTDVPFFDEAKITLIKMQGDIDQPDSLVITEDDIDAFISRLPTISDVVRAFFATKTLIFLGYDLNTDQFKRFYRQVTRNLSNFRRTAFAILPQPLDKVEQRYWREQNMTIHTEETLSFLEKLADTVKTTVKTTTPAPNPLAKLTEVNLPSRPYKALESFTPADEAIFSSRLEESYRLTNRLLAHRLTVLYGESGSGKTSLLQAGVNPCLARNRTLLAICAPVPEKPFPTLLRETLLQAGMQAGLPQPEENSLLAIIRTWQRELDAPIVLALDQFEQFFMAYSPQEQRTTISFLADLVNDRSLDVRLLLVIRADFLSWLDTLADELPHLMDMRFRLDRLGREAARVAIEDPARLFNITWEPLLVQRLLDELYEVDEYGVAPPQLQLVCDYLYQTLIVEATGENGEYGGHISLAQFEALGGTQTILGDYLDRVMTQFDPAQRAVVQMLLGALVTSNGVKQRLSLTTLSLTANAEPALAVDILDNLTRQRLLQRYEVSHPDHDETFFEYELTHDYLVRRIVAWLGTEFWATQKVRELLREALPEWQSRSRLLPIGDLRLIKIHQAHINFTLAEQELLYASIISYNDNSDEWVFELPEVACEKILLTLFTHPEPFIRRRVARHLATFASPKVESVLGEAVLDETDSGVQQAILETIAYIPPAENNTRSTIIHQQSVAHIVSATANPAIADKALAVLIALRDLQPAYQALLPRQLQSRILRQVGLTRFKRNRAKIWGETLRGLKDGFLSLGLVMGPVWGISQFLRDFQGLQVESRVFWATLILGLSLTGMIGALAMGSNVFVQNILHSMLDRTYPRLVWLITAIAGGISFGLGFLGMGYLFPAPGGQSCLNRVFLAGLLVGFSLTAITTLPYKLSTWLRLGITLLAGGAIFALIGALQLAFVACPISLTIANFPPSLPALDVVDWLMLALMGATAGFGFWWVLRPGD